jgi:transmembrane sensor
MSKAPYEDLRLRRQRAMQEAAAWLVRLQEEAPDPATRSAYTDWLRESPLHVASMLRVSHTDSALSAFDGWDAIPDESGPFSDTVVEWPASMEAPSASPVSMRSSRVNRLVLSAAVACVVAIGCALWWSGLVGGTVFETAIGERRDVALQDGSTLILGPETRLSVELSRSQRYIALERGEALFKVAKDAQRPFVVAVDRVSVRAVGTAFGVEKRGDSVLVTVAEGRVAVTQSTVPTLLLPESSPTPVSIPLVADEQISIPRGGASNSGSIRKVDAADSLGWANGRLVFNNDTIGSIIERFNQYNRVRITVTDPHIAERRISGSFDASDPESLLSFLSSSIPITISRVPERSEISIGTP